MTVTAVNCAEIRSGFVSGQVPEGRAVAEHLRGCATCRELFEAGALLGRALSVSVVAPPRVDQLLQQVSAELDAEVGLRAKARSLPTVTRVVVLAAVAATLVAYQLLMHRRADFVSYSPVAFWGIALLLLLALLAGAWVMLRGVLAPVGASRARWTAPLLLLMPVLVALLSPLGAGADSAAPDAAQWAAAGSCFSYGAALVMPVLLVLWLLDRRDSLPLSVLLAAGGVAGLAANLLLHVHCPSVQLGHLLLGHASIGAAWAVVLGLLLGRLQRAR